MGEKDEVPYISHDYIPKITCPGCTLCRTYRKGMDTCNNITTEGNQFYVAVATHTNDTSSTLRFKGTNLTITTASPPDHKNITKIIPSRVKNGTDHYMVICTGLCRTIHATLNMESGDADLFGHHDKLPGIENQNCKKEKCTLCKSRRSSTHTDFCQINLAATDEFYDSASTFFLSVHAYSNYTNANLTVKGTNLSDVVLLTTDLPPTTTPPPTTPTPNPTTSVPTSTSTTQSTSSTGSTTSSSCTTSTTPSTG